MNKILVIDNYDSFTYNLVHYVEELGHNVQVYRNDSPYDTVFVGVERTSTSVVTLSTVEPLSTDEARVLITEIL